MIWLWLACVPLGPDGERWCAGDADDDGYSALEGDTRPGDGDGHPGAPELCNGLDDDFDGAADEELEGCNATRESDEEHLSHRLELRLSACGAASDPDSVQGASLIYNPRSFAPLARKPGVVEQAIA